MPLPTGQPDMNNIQKSEPRAKRKTGAVLRSARFGAEVKQTAAVSRAEGEMYLRREVKETDASCGRLQLAEVDATDRRKQTTKLASVAITSISWGAQLVTHHGYTCARNGRVGSTVHYNPTEGETSVLRPTQMGRIKSSDQHSPTLIPVGEGWPFESSIPDGINSSQGIVAKQARLLLKATVVVERARCISR